MSTHSFSDCNFQAKPASHADSSRMNIDEFMQKHGNPDDPKFDWEYFGDSKYGRYAFCRNTQIKRGLTMGEFYGTSSVD